MTMAGSTVSSSETAPVRTATGAVYDPRSARAVLVVLTGMALMVTYVETMVVPGFQTFYTFFAGVPYTTIAWILSAYLLVGTVATPIFGKLGDRYGKKRTLLVVMAVYGVAITLAGFTPNLGDAFGVARANQIYLLIGVRALQGLGMAMFPLAFAMIPEVFPARSVGTSQGIISGMFGGGAALGLVGGGYVTQQFGWQVTFHTVIPFAFTLLVLAAIVVRESPSRVRKPIDIVGIGSLGFALGMFLFGITEGSSWGWAAFSAVRWGGLPWGVPEFFLLAVAGTVVFVLREQHVEFPAVSFTALRQRNIWVSNVTGALVGAVQFLFFVTFVLLVEDPLSPGFGLSEFQMGLLALPSVGSMLAAGPLLGVAVSRWGPKPICVGGFAAMGLGAVGLALYHGTVPLVILLSIPLLVGNVAVLIATTNVIVLSVASGELGIQTGMNQTFRNLGSAVGPVAATTIVASFVTTVWVSGPGGVRVPVEAPANAGFVWAAALAAALAVVGFVVSLALRRLEPAGARLRAAEPAEGN
jgi:MFS family permease